MRLISLVLTLVIISALIIYYKNSLIPVDNASNKTVKEQTKEVIDQAKQASDQMQKAMEEQQRKMEEQLEKQNQ